MKKPVTCLVCFLLLGRGQLVAGLFRSAATPTLSNIPRQYGRDRRYLPPSLKGKDKKHDMKEPTNTGECRGQHPPPPFLPDQPLLRGEFHRFGALCYPPLLGLPLFLRSQPHNRVAALMFSLAVEGIMVVSATLHTYPWKHHHQDWYMIARKADFAMIFVGIALFYSSIGKLLLGGTTVFTNIIEPLVWMCAVLGVLTKWWFPEAPPWLNATIFLVQGWAIGPLLPEVYRTVSPKEAAGLVLGGIFITLGAAAYSVRWPNGHWRFHPDIFGPHEMFHIGTLLMFVSFWSTMWVRVAR